MTESTRKILLILLACCGLPALAIFAYARPGYFTAQGYAEWLLLLEFLILTVWLYRQVFFPAIIAVFLFAGIDVPFQNIWTPARWGVLGLGALVGWTIILKNRPMKFGLFHGVAFAAALAALVSAMVSRYAGVSSLKALSLLMLFVYAATGARLAVVGRENRFFAGLIICVQIFVGLVGINYLTGGEVMGSPNSLGAVTGVVTTPILLWGMLVSERVLIYHLRLVFFAFSCYLTFISEARAGMLAAFCSCVLLCIVLRRYRLLMQGIGVVLIISTAAAILRPEAFSNTVSTLTSSVVFKNRDGRMGILASRESPWNEAIETIRTHFWFGTGFGTSDTGRDVSDSLGKFSTVSSASKEHGSSFLAITEWVGMLGVLPFALLVCVLLTKIFSVTIWIRRTGNAYHPAVPLVAVMVAGLLHAAFEDWLFAPGYYLCIFFWSLAFVLMDYVPSDLPHYLALPANPIPAALPLSKARVMGTGSEIPTS